MKRLISILSALSMAASVCAIPAAAEETTAAPIMMTAMTSTTTATFPPVAGTIVTTGTTAESESTTTTTTSPFPEVDGDQKALFTDKIWVYDGSTNDPVGGIDVQYVEYDADPSKDPDAQIVRVLAEWNTAQVNPAAVNVYEYTEGHFYGVEIPQLPEGYSHEGDGFVSGYGLHNRTGDSLFGIQLPVSLQPWDPLPEVASYPVEDTVEVRFQLEDGLTGEPITGVEMECVDSGGQPVTENWITGMDPHAIRCPVYLSDARSGAAYYFRIADGETLPTPFRKDAYERLDSLHCGSVGINESTYRMILRDGFYEYTFMLYPEDLHTEDPLPEIEAYPVEDTVQVQFNLVDGITGEPITDVPMHCVDDYDQDTWTSSEQGIVDIWLTKNEPHTISCPVRLADAKDATYISFEFEDFYDIPQIYRKNVTDRFTYGKLCGGFSVDAYTYRTILRDGVYEYTVTLYPEGAETEPPQTTTRTEITTTTTETTTTETTDTEPMIETPDCAEEPVTTLPPETTTTAQTTTTPEPTTAPTTTTTVTTTAETSGEPLPQTGMPWAKPLTGLAALLSVTGAAFVLKSRK